MKLRKKQSKTEPRKKKKVSQAQVRRSRSASLKGASAVNSVYDVRRSERLGRDDLNANPTVRFEATIHAGPKSSAGRIDQLDIDRVPGPKGQLRALVTANECVQLLDEGFEVRLHHAHPVRPLDSALIATDESVRRWLDEKVLSLTRSTGQKKSKRGKRT